MKVKAENAYQFMRHCKALAGIAAQPIDGLPEFIGLELYTKLARIESKARRLTVAKCNRSLTTYEESQLKKLGERARFLISEEFRPMFFVNTDGRGYALKLRSADEGGRIPEGISQDWGGYGILAPEF